METTTIASEKQVVVVDDDPVHRRFLERALHVEGYGVTSCASGQEALEVVKKQPPDLLILDIMMPGMDGFELAEALQDRGDLVPMVFLSASDEPEVQNQAFTMGVPLLVKPIGIEELHRVLPSQLASG